MGRRKLDLVGQRFGRLTVVNFDKKINKKYFWNCICDCGEKIIRPGQSLISGQTQSCGCLQKERAHETHFKDLMGRKFSRIKVISFKGIYNKRTYWNCICDCGKEKVINGDYLKRGLILSCGCLRNERIRETQLKDLTGKIFGRITVINFDRRKNGNIFWNCICKCGKKISINGNSLKRGLTVSCGCYNAEKRKERIGEKSSRWLGGISFEPYCPKFNNDLKRRIRTFFNYECVLCGKSQIENGKQLACHHVEYNKKACCDGKPVHFAALCSSCHAKTNDVRERWESMLHRIIDEIYDGKSYYTKEEWKEIIKEETSNGKFFR